MATRWIATAVTLALGALVAPRPATAADFYILYLSTDPDDFSVELMDPASIRTTPDGHKTVREASISPLELWQDNVMEYDCSTKRYQTLSSKAHLAGGDDIDRSTIPGMVGVWDTAAPDELAYLAHDTVCGWTGKEMTGDSVYTAPDFESAELSISERLYQMENEKK